LASPFPPLAPDFAPTTRAPAAAAEILARLLATVEANLPGLRQDLDTEFVHDLRVALRRARSLLRELRSALPEERTRWLRDGLSWLAELTGPVRDHDVLLLALPDYAAALPERSRDDLQPLIATLAAARRGSLATLLAALESPSGLALLADGRALARELADASGPALRQLADRRLRKVGRRVAKRAAKTTRHTPAADLHRLRIEAKRLRYLLEFFRSLYDGDRVAAVLRALRRLQETLGELQDLSVHAARLEAVPPEEAGWPPATLLATGRLLAELERRMTRRRREIDQSVRRFVHDEPGRLARLLASQAVSESV
jgi:CHAD domain-containing protein